MSVKIKVSYQETGELDQVLELLWPVIKSYRIAREQSSVYRRAYILLKEDVRDHGNRE